MKLVKFVKKEQTRWTLLGFDPVTFDQHVYEVK